MPIPFANSLWPSEAWCGWAWPHPWLSEGKSWPALTRGRSACTLTVLLVLLAGMSSISLGGCVFHYTCHDANCSEGRPKQRQVKVDWYELLCFWSPIVHCAFGADFVPCDRSYWAICITNFTISRCQSQFTTLFGDKLNSFSANQNAYIIVGKLLTQGLWGMFFKSRWISVRKKKYQLYGVPKQSFEMKWEAKSDFSRINVGYFPALYKHTTKFLFFALGL